MRKILDLIREGEKNTGKENKFRSISGKVNRPISVKVNMGDKIKKIAPILKKLLRALKNIQTKKYDWFNVYLFSEMKCFSLEISNQ